MKTQTNHVANHTTNAFSNIQSKCISQQQEEPIKPKSLPANWITTLFLRFNIIWGNKWSSQIPDEICNELARHEWGTALYGFKPETINNALNYCKMNLEWPPSIAQFIGICESENGVPTLEEVSALLISGNLEHPLVKIIHHKLDTWAFRHATAEQARKMLKPLYKNAKADNRMKELMESKMLEYEQS